ncbi:hypothetical protein U27_04243 [Candidatus Vecturithrix granuli]|uniref:Uncharacterized protein n=1 Tax=Vecturithrix granuli TaxID=1499967 RepID=A0A081BY73_VECG1|nr:hypothetical protein U27_04243 [Candidatus Vecturithrix granuli]
MPGEFDDLLKKIEQKHLQDTDITPSKKRFGKIGRFFGKITDAIGDFLSSHKRGIFVALLVLLVVLSGVYLLAKDYLTKRQNYPERNVLFRATNTVYIAGGSEKKGAANVDQYSETEVYEGGVESKVGTYLFATGREVRDDIEYFNMDDSQKIRIASATRKPEIVQAGLRIGGSLNFKEQFAEIISNRASKTPQSYRVYKFVPERGLKELEVSVVSFSDDTMRMETLMTEVREYLLGWWWGKVFRAGTFLEQYVISPDTENARNQFQEHIRILDSQQTINQTERERMVRQAMAMSVQIPRTPIYMTYEDGLFDILPQESTIYLAHKPGYLERVKDAFFGKSEHIRLRVENYADLFPGRYPLLRHFHIGAGDNVVYPFDKYNNGGYIIYDRYGKLAQIDIRDFILFYGQDVLYSYYFDLNGDGKLDQTSELIGTVLCRTTHDERIELERLVGEGRPKTDVTFTAHYSFMAPSNDLEQGMAYFNLCGYVESMLPDQLNRGFGKHSFLGYINQHRSDIMLFRDLTIENMSRALTQESTLVAKYDIVKAMIAAKRPYAQQLAEAYNLADQFVGQYQPPAQLVERRDWSVMLKTLAVVLVVIGGGFLLRKKKEK